MKHRKSIPALAGLLLTVTAASATTTTIDSFSYASFLNDQTYWTRSAVSSANNAFISSGKAALRAQTDSNARSAIISPLLADFNFFTTGFAVGLTGFELLNANLLDSETYFRMAFSSTAARQFDANDAVTLRLDKTGNVLFGYKMNQSATDAENKSGSLPGSLANFNYAGSVTAIDLTLAPLALNLGVTTVGYAIALNGSAGLHTVTGTFDAAQADWGLAGDSALMLESRRQNAVALAGSLARANIDSVTYTTPVVVPEPSALALVGLGSLLLGNRRRN